MEKISRNEIMSLEEYDKCRADYRKEIMEYKKHRRVHIGDHATVYFEDRKLMLYQIQEMLRAEKTFDEEGITEEIDSYNPMIPDGQNLKATFMIEYPDPEERKVALTQLVGIEDTIWMRVAGHDKVYAIADEEIERDSEDKTSSVHTLRFEFSADMIADAKNGADIDMGIEHDKYQKELCPLDKTYRDALVQDFI